MFISRVEDTEVRRAFTDYFNLVNEAKDSANAARYPVVLLGLKEVYEKGRTIKDVAKDFIDNFVPEQALADRLVELLRATNAGPGYEFWDGRDMSKAGLAGQ